MGLNMNKSTFDLLGVYSSTDRESISSPGSLGTRLRPLTELTMAA